MRKGFTLIELITIIGILMLVLTAVVIITRPLELLAQARDSQRINDFSDIKTALTLYLSSTDNPDLDGPNYNMTNGCGKIWWMDVAAPQQKQPFLRPFDGEPSTYGPVYSANLGTNIRNINGTGWIPLDFTSMKGGSPFGALPTDPRPFLDEFAADIYYTGPQHSRENGRYYAYTCDNTTKTFELNANMESIKYSFGGSADKESTDGGTLACQGNLPAWHLTPPGDVWQFPERCVYNPYNPLDPNGNPLYEPPIFSTTYYADHIYEVGNDPGLDL